MTSKWAENMDTLDNFYSELDKLNFQTVNEFNHYKLDCKLSTIHVSYGYQNAYSNHVWIVSLTEESDNNNMIECFHTVGIDKIKKFVNLLK